MSNYFFVIGIGLALLVNVSCGDGNNAGTGRSAGTSIVERNTTESNIPAPEVDNNVKDSLPAGFILFEEKQGDLNKDGVSDRVMIIKGTDKSNIVKGDAGEDLDRNRRGIIVQLNKNGRYEEAVRNYTCFSSENEDGGVYYAPELDVSINNNNLYVAYDHGRYGFWTYTFRYKNSDFELIGYDQSENRGPVINVVTSINFLSRKKIVKRNTNEDAEGGDEVFEKTETGIKAGKLIKLSEIEDFDELLIPRE